MSESVLTDIEQYVVDFVYKKRTEKKLNQSDIGIIIGTSQAFVAAVEHPKKRSKYNLNHINALADSWGLSPHEFLPQKAFKVFD